MKIINIAEISNDIKRLVISEIDMMKQLDHPYIIKIKDYIQLNIEEYAIVMSYADSNQLI